MSGLNNKQSGLQWGTGQNTFSPISIHVDRHGFYMKSQNTHDGSIVRTACDTYWGRDQYGNPGNGVDCNTPLRRDYNHFFNNQEADTLNTQPEPEISVKLLGLNIDSHGYYAVFKAPNIPVLRAMCQSEQSESGEVAVDCARVVPTQFRENLKYAARLDSEVQTDFSYNGKTAADYLGFDFIDS